MKSKRNQDPQIKEINVDQLVKDLRRGDDGAAPSLGPVSSPTSKKLVGKHSAAATKPNYQQSTSSQDNLINLSPPNKPTGHDTASSEDASTPDNRLSRSKKQRLRMQRKLQMRQAAQAGENENDSLPGMSENDSDDEASRSADNRGPRTPRLKGKRNYVERTSASAMAAASAGSCGWRDLACISFVLLLLGVAGFLKFQEEVFGSMDHLRSEADADADFYEILGVAHSATARDIKRAYRTKVMDVHPDRHPECTDCAQKFMATTKAYETLIDEDKRKVYDQTRGSYEPILSDYSVSLTYFNYHKVVTESPYVWVIEVYDDLDPSSKHFGSTWDVVAGSKLSSELVRFGRVNARRDGAVLSLLPIRARQYPTVIMFARDTLPSIFSLADMSSNVLSAWIQKNVPSHVNEGGSNRYKLLISGRYQEPPFIVKTASVRYARMLDFEYTQSKSVKGGLQTAVFDEFSGKELLTFAPQSIESILSLLVGLKERLVLPINRDNLADACLPDATENAVYCEFTNSIETPLNKTMTVDGGVVLQRVFAPTVSGETVLDLQGGRLANNKELHFESIDIDAFMSEKFPESFFGMLKRNRNTLVVALCMVAVFLAVTKVGALQITIAVAFLSMLVGLLSSPLAGSFFEWFNAKLR